MVESAEGAVDSGQAQAPVEQPVADTQNSDATPVQSAWHEQTFGEGAHLKGLADWGQFKSPSEFLDHYNSAQDMIARSIRIPTSEANEETWSKFYDKLKDVPGVAHQPEGYAPPPESPDGYRFDSPEGWDEGDEDSFAAIAHENGLTNEQANAVRSSMIAEVMQERENALSAQAQDIAELQKDWGPAFDREVGMAQSALEALEIDNPGLTEYMESTGLTENPRMIRFFNNLSKRMGDTPIQEPGQPGGVMTRSEAEARINDVVGNMDHPANNPGHPGHAAAQEEMLRWYRIARPAQ